MHCVAFVVWCNFLSETSVCGDCADATLPPAMPFARRESRAGECWAVGEVLAEKPRETRIPVYVGLVVVRAASATAQAIGLSCVHVLTYKGCNWTMQAIALTVLGTCFCYALKICCFKLTPEPMHVGVDVKQRGQASV